MTSFRVVPDGIIFDHVGEFAYLNDENIRVLYGCDPLGYRDAIMKVVQTLACSEKLLSGVRPPATEPTGILKERLMKAGRLEQADFFGGLPRESWEDAGNKWMSVNWNTICRELDDPNSAAETSMSGHLQREFYYFWLRLDPNWDASWFSPENESLELPMGLLERLLQPVSELAHKHNVRDKDGTRVTDDTLRRWICQNLTTHFRVFGEYWKCLGRDSRDEYMPALTRSCLKLVEEQARRHSDIETIVMPYVGLEALKNVSARGDLVERVVEWSESEGAGIVEGLQQLQWAVRTSKPDEQKRILAEVEAILKAKWTRRFHILLNLAKVVIGAARQSVEIDAAKTVVELSTGRSYRWLWQIRDPELRWNWQQRIDELVG
jgi:hypothetical protein